MSLVIFLMALIFMAGISMAQSQSSPAAPKPGPGPVNPVSEFIFNPDRAKPKTPSVLP